MKPTTRDVAHVGNLWSATRLRCNRQCVIGPDLGTAIMSCDVGRQEAGEELR